MKNPTAPQPASRRRPFFDPRFAIGLSLVVVSVVAVCWLVSSADSSTAVLAARSSLSPGQHVDARDFTVVAARLDHAEGRYLRPADLPDNGLVLDRAIGEGELVPLSALGVAESDTMSSIVVDAAASLPTGVRPTARVDVWAAAEDGESGKFGAPSVIVSDATVVRLISPSGIIVDESAGSVEILVPEQSVARLLEALANDEAISLVPSTVPRGQSK